jgi:hypothetical protein
LLLANVQVLVCLIRQNPAWQRMLGDVNKPFSASNEAHDISCIAAASNPRTNANTHSYSRDGMNSPTLPICFSPDSWDCSKGKLFLKDVLIRAEEDSNCDEQQAGTDLSSWNENTMQRQQSSVSPSTPSASNSNWNGDIGEQDTLHQRAQLGGWSSDNSQL